MALSDKYNENIYFKLLNFEQNGYIAQFGHVIPSPNYILKKRKLMRHLFDYVVSGKGYIIIDDNTYNVRTGDLIYIRKGVTADYGADTDDPYDKLWFGADGPVIDAFADCYLAGQKVVILHNRDESYFLRLKSLLASKGYDERQVMHLLLDLFLELAGISQSQQIKTDSENDLAECIKNHIDLRVTENLSLDKIADELHISKRHVIRVFKDRYDLTPGAYHCQLRMTAACHYLNETSISVSEIAARLGFCDQSFFSSAFKKHFGIYPLAYRKKYHNS